MKAILHMAKQFSYPKKLVLRSLKRHTRMFMVALFIITTNEQM